MRSRRQPAIRNGFTSIPSVRRRVRSGRRLPNGFLTLALCVPMLDEVLPETEGMVVNYGVNRVRFPAPVPSGSRIRGRFRVTSTEDTSGGMRAIIAAAVECEGVEKPVCVADLVLLMVP
jgi:acyl dehydratase